MADIFLSYAHEDRGRAASLASALEREGWSVFWDRTIPTGKSWRDYIGNALHEAKCVVVAWSRASITSEWVHEEADDGRERKILVPVLLEAVKPPLGFRAIQAEALFDWDGDPTASEFRKLVGDIESLLGPPPVRHAQPPLSASLESPHQDSQPMHGTRAKTPGPAISKAEVRSNTTAHEIPASKPKITSYNSLPKVAVVSVLGLVILIGLGALISVDRSRTHALGVSDRMEPATDRPTRAVESPDLLLQQAKSQRDQGLLLGALGNRGAIDNFRRVLVIQPNNKEAKDALSDILLNSVLALSTFDPNRTQADIEEHGRIIQQSCQDPIPDMLSGCQAARDMLSRRLNKANEGPMTSILN